MRDKHKDNPDQVIGNTTKTESTDSGRRRRLPRDPNTMHGYLNKEEELPVIGDLYQKRTDGITADPDKENRSNAQNNLSSPKSPLDPEVKD